MEMESVSDDEISLTSTVESEQQSEYEVKTILAEHEWPQGMRYLIQWTGYSIDRSTWEPAGSSDFNQTLLDWEKKKQQIADGREPAFDVAAWEARVIQLDQERSERKRRREAKRRKIASAAGVRNYWPVEDAIRKTKPHKLSSGPASGLRPPGPGPRSLFSDQVHPARQGLLSGSSPPRQPPVLFGNSQTAPDPVRQKKAASTDKLKLFKNLSTKNRHEKLGKREPAPDINQLDLRRPSEWASMSSTDITKLGSSRSITDTTDNSPTGHAAGSVLDPPRPLEDSPIASPTLNNGSWNNPSLEHNGTSSLHHNNTTASVGARIPASEFNLQFLPRVPSHNARHISPKRWWNLGEYYVSMYFGPEKLDIGNARVCGIGYEDARGLYKMKSGKIIELWFRDVCSLDDYHALCDGMRNERFANGWIEGFNDNEPKIRKVAKSLWQDNRVAIAYINAGWRKEVLLAYPPRSRDFNFLDADPSGPEQGYLNLTLRSALGPLDRLRSNAEKVRPHLAEANNLAKNVHFEPTKVNGSSGVKPSRNLDVAQDTIGQFSAASTLSPPDTAIYTPSTSLESTDKTIVQGPIHLPTEPMNLDHRPSQVPTPSHTRAICDTALDLDNLFRTKFGITFEGLSTLGGSDKPQRAEMFYVWFPGDSELIRNEKELCMRFLKQHTPLLYSNSDASDWEKFVTMVKKNIMQGVVLFHESFVEYDKIPFFREILRRVPGFWNVSISQPLKYADRPLHVQRLFPHGGVFLVTEDFMVREPDDTMIILEWFYEWTKKKFPGTWKIMLRPNILNWLLKQVDLSEKPNQPSWLAIYHLVKRLGFSPTDDLLPSIEDDHINSLILSPPTLPMYGSRTADDSPNIPRNCSQEQRNSDHLAEFFAGWSLINAHRFRRFIMITALEPLERWTKWQHIDVRYGPQNFYQTQSIDPKPIRAKLLKGVPDLGSSSTEPVSQIPGTPRPYSTSTPTTIQKPASSVSQSPFRHQYSQPYQ
ncbi:hypothetical protein BDW62DRAFT_203094 [Aspergillus aurantiobrunneus]